MIDARFGHVNVIARDWRALATFYTELFGCVLVPPERDYAGPDLERGTAVPGATLRGAHLRLPGHGPDGPTLEIYQFGSMPDGLPPLVNRPASAISRSPFRQSRTPERPSWPPAAASSATSSRSRRPTGGS